MKKTFLILIIIMTIFSVYGCNQINDGLLARINEIEMKNQYLENQLNELKEAFTVNEYYTNTGILNLYDENGPENQNNTEIKFYFNDKLTFSVRVKKVVSIGGILNAYMVIQNYTNENILIDNIKKYIVINGNNGLLHNEFDYNTMEVPANSKYNISSLYGSSEHYDYCDIGVYRTGKYITCLPIAVIKDILIDGQGGQGGQGDGQRDGDIDKLK